MPPKKNKPVADPTEIQTVCITSKGELKKAKVALTEGAVTVDAIQAYLKKKTAPEQLGKYSHEGTTIFLYGYNDGKAGSENKYEFPPPYDSLLPFGDVVLIASQSKSLVTPVAYAVAQWETFYEQAMGGFDSIGSEEELLGDVDESDEEIDAVPSDVEEEEEVIIPDEPESEEDEKPVRVEPKKKKSSTAIVSGYQKQMALLAQTGFKELSTAVGTADQAAKQPLRQKTQTLLRFLIDLGFAEKAVDELESGIYAATITEADRKNVIKHWDNALFTGLYQMTVRTVCTHLHPASPVKNERLLERIRTKEIKLENLPQLTAQELFPENWKELADRQAIREQKLLEGNKAMATDRYKCGRCGKRECTYYEMQTRSADEPMTIFISCLNCGKRWRQ
jgi:transcription elongation factor S-II